MRPGNRRQRPGLELGVILLLYQMLNVGFGSIPLVTLCGILGQVCLYLGVINVPWSKWDVCISADTILRAKDYRRFILSTFEHGDDMHLYYNMISFLIKGRTLENRYGSSNFALLLAFLVLMTNAFYVALSEFGSQLLEDYSMMKSCAIGFSGVLFALKVITTSETAPGTAYIMGMPVPSKYAAWVELIAIHLLVPNASFMGHLSGILAGCLYTSTFVGGLIDYMISSVTGWPMFHGVGHQSYQTSSSGGSYSDSGYDTAGFQTGAFGSQFGSSGFGSRFGSSGFGSRFGSSGFGSQFGSSGFGSFGPNLIHRTYTSRQQEYGWRY